MYLISLYFDEKSNTVLQKHIERIAYASTNTFMLDNNVPPHMTISAIEARNEEDLISAMKSIEGTIFGGEIQFVSVGQLFPYVMYATPVLNDYLLSLSNKIYSTYEAISGVSISNYYQPNSWLPHVTLGKTLNKEQMRKAFEKMQDSFVPFSAIVTEIGIAKVNPHEDLLRYNLPREK